MMEKQEKSYFFTDSRQFISDCQTAIWDKALQSGLQESGVQLSPSNFYSSIPSINDINASFEQKGGVPLPIYGDIFRKETIREFCALLEEFARDFHPKDDGDESTCTEFFWNNTQFSNLDAVAYYSIIRHLKPARVVEIGSGFSTLAADAAIKANGFGEIISIEPYPRPFMEHIASVKQIVKSPVQDISIDAFNDLMTGADILFIDTTHTVKIGSDCLYIYLKLLPSLRRKVAIHSHDIFLPFGMPPHWAIDHHIYWTEQYLLYALLLQNPAAKVLFGSTYVAEFIPEAAAQLVPSGRPIRGGGSLWYTLL